MILFSYVVFFKQKTAYEMRISDWSSDVCSSDLQRAFVEFFETGTRHVHLTAHFQHRRRDAAQTQRDGADGTHVGCHVLAAGTITARRRAHQHAMLVAQAEDRKSTRLNSSH